MTTTVRDPLPGTAPDTDDEPALLAWLARLRDEAPVWTDRFGTVHVVGHDDVLAVTRDPETFSSDLSAVSPAAGSLGRGMLTRIDPPEHRALRRVVSAAFTPHTVARLEPRIRALAAGMLDAAGERFDLVDALAFPLPVTVIAELLGLPPADQGRFRAWAEGLFSMQVDDPTDPALGARVAAALGEITGYLAAHCRARRADPGDDLVSALVTAEVDGRALDDEEAATFAMLLLLAGHITTTLLLGNAVRTFAATGTWTALRDDPASIPAAVEEVLRLRPPFPAVARATTREVVLSGRVVPARTVVVAWVLAANHDPRVHADPERFDPARGVAGGAQLAFGHGVHFCLGAPLARLEARVVLEEMAARFAGLTVSGVDLRPYTRGVIGTRALPVVATRRGHDHTS